MKNIIAILLFLCSFATHSQTADDIIGEYWTDTKEGRIEIYRKDNTFFGKIIWRKEAIRDSKNPNPDLRNRSVIGLVFLKDFKYKKGKWIDGTVYSIDNGNTYSGKLWLEKEGKILKMRGYVGFSLLGRTATLTRVKNSVINP